MAQTGSMRNFRTQIVLGYGFLLLACDLIIFAKPLPFVSVTACLVAAGFLPGALLVDWWVGAGEARPTLGERVLYTAGSGYALIVVTMLLICYLPGGIDRQQVLVAVHLLDMAMLVLWLWQRRRPTVTDKEGQVISPMDACGHSSGVRRWIVVGLLALTLVAGFYRFANLGYSEFQGDEAGAALAAAEEIQGYENALFVHKKGPAEILIPGLVYSLTGRLTETDARFPFALANLCAVLTMFLLGSRLFGPVAGWSAALLLTLDGYLIAFGRILQYQSIVFLMAALTVTVLYRLARHPRALTNYLMLAAWFLATGLLAHYEAATAVAPALLCLWYIGQRRTGFNRLAKAMILPLVFGAALLALFYVPYVLNPDFGDTYRYVVGYRIAGKAAADGLVEVFQRTTLYSTTYYFLLLIGLAVVAMADAYRRCLSYRMRVLAILAVFAGVAVTFVRPDWLTIAGHNHTGLFYLGALALVWFAPTLSFEERMVWVWFGIPMVVALFYTAIPGTHVYIFFIPWALLAGMVIGRAWEAMAARSLQRNAQIGGAVALALFLPLFGLYEYSYFVYHGVEILRTWKTNRPPGYWVTYDTPEEESIFGFPLRNGWKTVASLYDQGVLTGAYATNTRTSIAEWYTRGQGLCPRDDPTYYLLAQPVEPSLRHTVDELRSNLKRDHVLFGTILVNAQPHIEIYQSTSREVKPRIFHDEDYAVYFDEHLLGARFMHNGPSGDVSMQHTAGYLFGQRIALRGYSVERTEVRPGDMLKLTLYWQALQTIQDDYFVSVQLIDLSDLHKAGQRDGQPGCNYYPTSGWIPGDLIADGYNVPIAPDAKAGDYTLLVTLYTDTGSLDVTDAAQRPVGTGAQLETVEVRAAAR